MHVLTKNLLKIHTNIKRNSFIQTEKIQTEHLKHITIILQDAICFFKTNSVYHFWLASNGKCFENEMSSHDLWQHEILFLFNWDKIYSWYQQQYKYFESTNTDIAHSL